MMNDECGMMNKKEGVVTSDVVRIESAGSQYSQPNLEEVNLVRCDTDAAEQAGQPRSDGG